MRKTLLGVTILEDERVPEGIVLVDPEIRWRAPDVEERWTAHGVALTVTAYAPVLIPRHVFRFG